MNKQQPTGAIWYPRVSRTNGRNAAELEKHTLGEQRDHSIAFLPRGVAFIEDPKYKDVNVSGRTSVRPGLENVFQAIEDDEADAVVVGYLSRFGRNAKELLQNLERLHRLGATLYVAKDGLILPPGTKGTTKMLVTILAAVAEMEADRLEEGLSRANAAALADGIAIVIPYGYRREDGRGSRLVSDERDGHSSLTPAAVVLYIFSRRLLGIGCSAIARELNELEVPTPTQLQFLRGEREKPGAVEWEHNKVKSIVETRTYTGVIPRAIAWETVTSATGPKRRPTAWEYLAGQHDPLVSDDDWKDAQLKGEWVRTGLTGDALLQGLVRCASCSRTMRPSHKQGQPGYECRGGACSRPARLQPRRLVDEYVITQLLEGHTEEHETSTEGKAELVAAREEVQALEDDLDGYMTLRREMDPAHYLKGYRARVADITEAQAEVTRLKRVIGKDGNERVRDLRDVPMADQQAILRDQLDAVVIRPAFGRGRGRGGTVEERVVLIGRGTAPFELSRSGRSGVPIRLWPLEGDEDVEAA